MIALAKAKATYRSSSLHKLRNDKRQTLAGSDLVVDCQVLVAGSGMVVSWGRGEDGQLGHGDANERPYPQTVHALTDANIDAVFCGAEYSAAVSKSGSEVFSWGWYERIRLSRERAFLSLLTYVEY